ncbi:MAG: hypothetical protein J7L08_02910 [Candidatus Aenigmarchaeota archaeon]|nr:hypothetical protein [Candidatus Aenigmarchaeota archaeon]
MKIGWQLREELPLFIIVLIIVSGVLWFFNPELNNSAIFGTAFLIAAVVTALEVIVDAIIEKKK